MTATLFSIMIIGVIFWLAFQEGILAFFAALCILGMIALIFDEARKEREEERWLKEKERAV
jgi:ABC-type transport system involved in cytochrome bd biosynthesis fused ATPase/permease subunit